MISCSHSSFFDPTQLSSFRLNTPTAFSKIYKEECCLCFKTWEEEEISVCLTCFHGGCREHAQLHFSKTGHPMTLNVRRSNLHCKDDNKEKETLDAQEQHHDATDETKRMKMAYDQKANSKTANPVSLSRVEIVPDNVEDNQNLEWNLQCQSCDAHWSTSEHQLSGSISLTAEEMSKASIGPLVDSILRADPARRKAQIQAWREERTTCQHVKSLVPAPIHRSVGTRCECIVAGSKENDFKSEKCPIGTSGTGDGNLWMCFECGNVACGRKQFDGSGGNGHAALHFNETGHAIALKLGTITPEGSADVHCYICDELQIDPKLIEHLNQFGIDVGLAEKTTKTLDELQLEQNLKFDFSMVSEDGLSYPPLSGPGLIGISNLGNSCYLASVLQLLAAVPAFIQTYGQSEHEDHIISCTKDPANCVVCQLGKVANAIVKGSPKTISPWMFKAVIGAGHSEFSTFRQQDASEFLSHLFKSLQRSDGKRAGQILSLFESGLVQKICCSGCGKVRVQRTKSPILQADLATTLQGKCHNIFDNVSLEECVMRVFESETVELFCPECKSTKASKQLGIEKYPKYLIVSLGRFIVTDWMSQKLDTLVIPTPVIDLAPCFMNLAQMSASPIDSINGKQDTEEIKVNEEALQQLMEMGFPRQHCIRALVETENINVDMAMNWIFENPLPPEGELVDALDAAKNSSSNVSVDPELLKTLLDAGFESKQAQQALVKAEGNLERAFDRLLSGADEELEENDSMNSNRNYDDGLGGTLEEEGGIFADKDFTFKFVGFVAHKGPSMHCGHYLAGRCQPELEKADEESWVLFNDERVVGLPSQQEMAKIAGQGYLYIYQRQAVKK